MRPYGILILVFTFVTPASAKPVRFDFRDAGGRNIVHFVSDAAVEKTIGLSSSIAGWLELDPDRLSEGVKGEFDVDVRTFHTGVELRNDFLKDKFMGASEFPIATFTLSRVLNSSKTKLPDGVPVTMRVDGTLKAKGVTRAQAILVRVTYMKESEMTRQRLPGNLLKVAANFDIDGIQYGAQIPESQKARFSRFIQVHVDAVGTDQPPLTLPPAPVEGPQPKPKENGKK